MAHPQYSKQYLSTLEPAHLKVIAKQLGLIPAFRKLAVIEQIVSHQAAQLKPATPATKTCRECPWFQSHGNIGKGSDKGWCNLFNQFARQGHQETQDCINAGERQEESDIADFFEEQQAEVLSNQEWEAAQSEVLEVLGKQIEAIAPEPAIKISENVYRVLSSAGTHRYQVDLWRRTCTCAAGAHRNPCRHIPQAEARQRQEVEAQMSVKLPAGWRQKADGWYYNSSGHRTNVVPI